MSQDGVDNTEMDLPEEPEAHLPSELVGDMRLAYGARLPRAGAALRSLLENGLARPEPQIQRSFRGSLVRLATVSLALFGTMSGLAVAGALPAPVQNAVSGVAETVGFDIPDSQPPAEQVVVGSGSSEDGTDGADGAGGDSTSQNAAPSTTPGSSGADDSDSPTVVPESRPPRRRRRRPRRPPTRTGRAPKRARRATATRTPTTRRSSRCRRPRSRTRRRPPRSPIPRRRQSPRRRARRRRRRHRCRRPKPMASDRPWATNRPWSTSSRELPPGRRDTGQEVGAHL